MWQSSAGGSKNVHSQVELNDSDEQEAPIISGATDNVLAESIDTKTLEKEYFYFRSSKQKSFKRKLRNRLFFVSGAFSDPKNEEQQHDCEGPMITFLPRKWPFQNFSISKRSSSQPRP